MDSLKSDFDTLINLMNARRDIGNSGFEPVYYLIFHPSQILTVKRHHSAWISRLEQEGWDVHTFSISEQILDILATDPRRKLWEQTEATGKASDEKITESFANAINAALPGRVEKALEKAAMSREGLLLLTDLEALHQYMRINTIEGLLTGKFKVPTVILYPGTRTGKSNLKFLGFYPADGNYRSVHVGG